MIIILIYNVLINRISRKKNVESMTMPYHLDHLRLTLFISLLIMGTSMIASANSLLTLRDWEKVKQEDGVTVYINKTGDSQIVRVKTEVTINSPITNIQTILDDVDNRKEWVPFLTESRVLHDFSPTEKLEYSIFYGPWPAYDRDFVYRITLNYKDNHKIIYSMISEISPFMHEQEDKVRAQLIESYYTLIALDDKTTQVELIFHADPKGYLPVWIVNIIQRVLPYLILKNLKELAEKTVSPDLFEAH